MRSIVMIGAHPDDETMLTGGVLALLSRHGLAVHIICATRGEGGEIADALAIPRERLGQVREQELRCAAQALGAAGVEFLGYIDPLVGPDDTLYPFEADFKALAGQIQQAIRRTQADLILTHGQDGEYGHPAHQLVHRAVRSAVEGMRRPPLLYTFAALVPGIEDPIWNKSEPAHLALDIRPWLDIKEAAALCHRSQHGLFARRHPGKAIRDVLRQTESVRRCCPPLPEGGIPDDPFAALLRSEGAWQP